MSRLTCSVRILSLAWLGAVFTPLAAQAPAAAPDTAKPAAAAPSLKISGFAEASYVFSNNSSGDSVIVGRLYDRFQNHFMLNALAVVLDLPYDPAKVSAGFHSELLFGQNASLIKSGGFDLGTQGDIPHLYVTLNLPTSSGNGVQFKIGRMVTLMGLEVIETNANPNWSEGNQFIYVENFTGLGVSVETKFNAHLDAQLRVFNGWDQIHDNNTFKSFMGRVGIYPDANTSIGIVGFWGPEEVGDNDSKRTGVEALIWRKLGKAAVWVQGDYGMEQANAVLPNPAKDAKWSAVGVWLTCDVTPSATLALRGDYVDDTDGARTNGFLGFPANTGHKFWSGTATLNVKTWPNALVRPEIRYDHSNLLAFNGKANQFTVAVGVTYSY